MSTEANNDVTKDDMQKRSHTPHDGTSMLPGPPNQPRFRLVAARVHEVRFARGAVANSLVLFLILLRAFFMDTDLHTYESA